MNHAGDKTKTSAIDLTHFSVSVFITLRCTLNEMKSPVFTFRLRSVSRDGRWNVQDGLKTKIRVFNSMNKQKKLINLLINQSIGNENSRGFFIFVFGRTIRESMHAVLYLRSDARLHSIKVQNEACIFKYRSLRRQPAVF